MIRITLEKYPRTAWDGQGLPATSSVREFEDDAEACKWVVEDAYFAEPHVRKMIWERVT